MMRRDLFVYISGPMTAKDGHTIEENVAAGVRVYLDSLARGIPAFCPHLSGAFPVGVDGNELGRVARLRLRNHRPLHARAPDAALGVECGRRERAGVCGVDPEANHSFA
jgi:hypothetical protein